VRGRAGVLVWCSQSPCAIRAPGHPAQTHSLARAVFVGAPRDHAFARCPRRYSSLDHASRGARLAGSGAPTLSVATGLRLHHTGARAAGGVRAGRRGAPARGGGASRRPPQPHGGVRGALPGGSPSSPERACPLRARRGDPAGARRRRANGLCPTAQGPGDGTELILSESYTETTRKSRGDTLFAEHRLRGDYLPSSWERYGLEVGQAVRVDCARDAPLGVVTQHDPPGAG